MQTAVEAEVEEFLGRARYQRAAGLTDARAGSRNGFCPTTVKTTAGPVTIERPKLRGTTEKFASRLLGAGVTPKFDSCWAYVLGVETVSCVMGQWSSDIQDNPPRHTT